MNGFWKAMVGKSGRVGRRPRRQGSALLATLVLAVTAAGLCAALLTVNLTTGKARVRTEVSERSFYAAEGGLSDAYMQLTTGLIDPQAGAPVQIGQPGAEIPFGPSAYWVDVSETGPRTHSLVSTGSDGADEARLELVVSTKATGFFQFAAFGAEGVVLDSNSFIDSYDSAYGSYASQVQGGNEYAKENGDIGSNADILLKSNTEIHGDAQPGPGHIVDDSAPNIYVSGSMDPLEEPFLLPPIETPSITSSGALVGNGAVVLGPGDVHYSSIVMMGGSSLKIVGPARLVVDDFLLKSNTQLHFDATAGEIELYAPHDFELMSNSTVTTTSNSALDVTLFLDGNNLNPGPQDKLQLGANADFIGAIYAPNAKFSLASNFNVFGSIMCGQLDLSSFGEIHFDEALLYDGYGASGELEPLLWRVLPRL